jgi:hypothetical protein
MTTAFDGGDVFPESFPDKAATYSYKIITPMRYGASIGFIYKKVLAIGFDYEGVNYSQANITSSSPSDFNNVNKVINTKYSQASNLRLGVEANIENVFVRAGYSMYGSPFGNSFSGKFVRSTYCGGVGFRNKNWSMDIGFTKSVSNEDYYMFNSKYVNRSDISVSGTKFVITVGCKF